MNKSQYKVFFWALFAFSLLLFFSPMNVAGADSRGLDKVVHFVLFAGLTISGLKGLKIQKHWLAVLLVLYAISVEHLQAYVGREYDIYDAFSGWAGVIFPIFIPKLKR